MDCHITYFATLCRTGIWREKQRTTCKPSLAAPSWSFSFTGRFAIKLPNLRAVAPTFLCFYCRHLLSSFSAQPIFLCFCAIIFCRPTQLPPWSLEHALRNGGAASLTSDAPVLFVGRWSIQPFGNTRTLMQRLKSLAAQIPVLFLWCLRQCSQIFVTVF
jgi:hypothetical protein